ncbi:MAG TPA: hypothetical protein VLF20_03410 [Patescibacteria group bacterium]|nr:hypothetical protein [Patescibacteria group bacterium]
MSLEQIQYWYYSLGVIFMSLFFLGLIIIIILIIVLLVRVNTLNKQINDIVTDVKEHPGEKAAEVLLAIGSKLADHKKSTKER